MTPRRRLLLASALAVVVCHRAGAQPSANVRRVGWLSLAGEQSAAHLYAAFEEGMREQGWERGRNVDYRMVFADGDADRLDGLARQLIAQKVDVIVVGNPLATRAAQRATSTIPIVMATVGDPVGNKFIESLARPGGNITGVTSQPQEVLGKMISILHEAAPAARRFAILVNESTPIGAAFWATAEQACTALNLLAIRVVATSSAQLGPAVDRIMGERAQAVVVVPDPVYLHERAMLGALMARTRLPTAYGWREHVHEGGLLSYSTDLAATFRYAAAYVDKVLKGAKPSDIPVEQATKYELVINLKTANALGLVIPPSLLLTAALVIK
jgi:putative ABC transport system substrate-binding protein